MIQPPAHWETVLEGLAEDSEVDFSKAFNKSEAGILLHQDAKRKLKWHVFSVLSPVFSSGAHQGTVRGHVLFLFDVEKLKGQVIAFICR